MPAGIACWLVVLCLLWGMAGDLRAQTAVPLTRIAEVAEQVAKGQQPLIRGVVTFQIAPGFVFVQDDSGAVCVHVRPRIDLSPGDVVEVVIDSFSTRGDWYVSFEAKVVGHRALPDALALSAAKARMEKHHALRLKVQGRVIGQSQSTGDYFVNDAYIPVTYDVLTTECDGIPVRMAFLAGTDVAARFPVGTVAEFTGVARIHDLKRDVEYLYIAMWVDGPENVRIVQSAPFWNSARVWRWTAVTGLALVSGLLIFGLGLLLQRRKLKLLRASEERFRALVDNSFELTVVLDAGGRIKYLTPAAQRLFGGTTEEGALKGSEFKRLLPQDDHDLVRRARDEVLSSPGKTVRIEDCRMVVKGGTICHVEMIGTNCLMVRGVEGIVLNIRDVTERRRAEETLRRSNADLEQRVAERTEELHRALAHERELGQMKSSFVSLVSHEFRTPLGVIMSAAEVLQRYFDSLTPEKRARHLDMVLRSTRNLAQLIDEVLLLGRVEGGKMQFEPELLNLEKVCRALVDEVYSATAGTSPIRLDCKPGTGEALTDETVLRHIVGNLLSNAIKYSDEGAPVDFEVERQNGDAVLTIRDHGIGIPAEDQGRLFTTFTRGSNVGQRPGTGLGLVIVERCVKLHNGTMSLHSIPGLGTTVTVRLPVFPQDGQTLPSPS